MEFQERRDKDVSDGLKIFVTVSLMVLVSFIWDTTDHIGHVLIVAVIIIAALVVYLSRARTKYSSREDDTQQRSMDQH